jgi:hypothetical protein
MGAGEFGVPLFVKSGEREVWRKCSLILFLVGVEYYL